MPISYGITKDDHQILIFDGWYVIFKLLFMLCLSALKLKLDNNMVKSVMQNPFKTHYAP